MSRTGSIHARLTITSIIAYSGLFFYLGLARHSGYVTSLMDLGVVDQAIWGLLNGFPFLDTVIFGEPANWLGFHFHAILAVFAPLYIAGPHPAWLTGVQAFSVARSRPGTTNRRSRSSTPRSASWRWRTIFFKNIGWSDPAGYWGGRGACPGGSDAGDLDAGRGCRRRLRLVAWQEVVLR